MSATATHQPPAVPPRPSRGQDVPRVPPRPIHRRVDRSVSPNTDRFAPSPLNDSFLTSKSPRAARFSPQNGKMAPSDPIDRAASVDLPSVGEEGMEYATVAEELTSEREHSNSPEHTRTVGEDIKLHAPKPSLPALSAKQRVATVTRTDSDRAASFGIGKPSSDEVIASNRSLKKKASTASQLSTMSEGHDDDEHGIPEIGRQVPMYPNAGDVQAPSPAPVSGIAEGLKKHHNRKTSSRGFGELPPGSYGLHGHGLKSTDRLEQAYFSKHPDAIKKEHHRYQDDRANDFSISSEQLNKIVYDTASRGTGLGTYDLAATPSEQVGWQVIEESASRINSPRPASTAPKQDATLTSPLKHSFSREAPVTEADRPASTYFDEDGKIHVDEPGRRKSVLFSDEEVGGLEEAEDDSYQAPILAEDEVAKNPAGYNHVPAVPPASERRGSAFEIEEPQSRPTSRPASIYKESFYDARSTPLEDVQEYEPLFPDDEKEKAAQREIARKQEEYRQRFPSRDVWEDAPNSVHYTAEVSTPDVPEKHEEKQEEGRPVADSPPPRETETPAQAFARQQEELAERESRYLGKEHSVKAPHGPVPSYAKHQPHLARETAAPGRPGMAQRFPSRDVWEDTPDSLQLQATVSTPQQEEASSQPDVPQRPARKSSGPSSASSDKPAIPERPKPKQTPSDEVIAKPAVPDRPKPQVPRRPAKHGSGSDKDGEASAPRAKPAVPVRPVGGKIAALQAGFMSDLNKRLQLGPQAPKKEEPPAQDLTEEKEKAPLADARKGRARGPQRRAPRSSPSPAAVIKEAPAEKAPSSLSFSFATTLFSIDPEVGTLTVNCEDKGEGECEGEGEKPAAEPVGELEQEPADEPEEEKADEPAAEKTETLATNMAGETILEAKVEEGADKVEPIEAEEVAKD